MNVTLQDNTENVLKALKDACEAGLERCGEKAEGYAKDLAPFDTGRLKNDITHSVDGNELNVGVYDGSGVNVDYAIYQEFGTGKYVAGGRPTPWKYQDENGNWHWTAGNRAHPFIKPSIAGHEKTYLDILQDELKKER